MSGPQPPRSSQDLGWCLALPAAACRLIVVIGVICSSVWRAMSVARTPDALVLDIESCDRFAGCPGCGLNRTRPRSYGGGGDRRAPGRGPGKVPVAQYGDGYAANTPARSRPLSSRTTRCAPPGRVWGPGRSAGRSDSCASKEPPSLAWLDNWQPRGTPCGPTSSRACKPHLMTPPASQACRYWELTSTYGITRTDAAGVHVSSPASWT